MTRGFTKGPLQGMTGQFYRNDEGYKGTGWIGWLLNLTSKTEFESINVGFNEDMLVITARFLP